MEKASVKIIDCTNVNYSVMYVNGLLEAQGEELTTMDWVYVIQKYNCFEGKIPRYGTNKSNIDKLGGFPTDFNQIPKEFLNLW